MGLPLLGQLRHVIQRPLSTVQLGDALAVEPVGNSLPCEPWPGLRLMGAPASVVDMGTPMVYMVSIEYVVNSGQVADVSLTSPRAC